MQPYSLERTGFDALAAPDTAILIDSIAAGLWNEDDGPFTASLDASRILTLDADSRLADSQVLEDPDAGGSRADAVAVGQRTSKLTGLTPSAFQWIGHKTSHCYLLTVSHGIRTDTATAPHATNVAPSTRRGRIRSIERKKTNENAMTSNGLICVIGKTRITDEMERAWL